MAGLGDGVDRSRTRAQTPNGNACRKSQDVVSHSDKNSGAGSRRRADVVKPRPMVVAAAGLEIGLVIAGLTVLGWWLDGKFDCRPWLMITGLFIGLVGGTYNAWKAGRAMFDD